MALNVQRSVPFPRVSLGKLLAYIEALGGNYGVLTRDEIRERGLDIGKGKGDITRFFLRIELVREGKDGIELTQHGWMIYDAIRMGEGAKQLHSYLASMLPQYKLLMDILMSRGPLDEDSLFNELNEEIRKISPSSWVNKVAFKALLGLLIDAHLAVKTGRMVRYINGDPAVRINACIDSNAVRLGDYYLISANKLSKCLGFNINLDEVDPSRISKAPGDSMIKVNDLGELSRLLIEIVNRQSKR
ncbi:hypothetical protein GCM10007981_11550 [Thermocladium modestius]|uniref:Uncharacterized protein n=1 Tax=Thermocladium modestius TaxID=62609 RepID=A0A830GX63_9CREN|nr:hypothetical protein [Thermocladium modestius]GGP21102.1 hypothetical protein GCM10007981_11550 [Thermocladium modestius]